MVVKLPDTCVEVGVPFSSWPIGIADCPNCRKKLQVSLETCNVKQQAPQSPSTPTVQPMYLAHEPLSFMPQNPQNLPSSLRLISRAQVCSRTLKQIPSPTATVITSPYTDELQRLAESLRVLRLSGWYYGNLNWQGARNLLKDASIGAFVVRDSGDRNFIFSLSVQTERGPTSVRLNYLQGFFRLDCDQPLERYMPRFRCVVELVKHYTQVGMRGAAGTVWVDRDGCPHSPVLLRVPMRKSPPSLLHSARLAIHKALDSNPLTPKLWRAPKHRHLPLPATLIDYLGEYPYSI